MAEETSVESTQQSSTPAINEDKIAELVKINAAKAVQEAMAGMQENLAQRYVTPRQEEPQPDYFESLIDSRTSQKLASLGLRAESADDRADFYSSDFWLEDVDEYLDAEDEADIKAAKRELKKQIETSFTNLINQGKGMKREEIAKHAIGDLIIKNKSKYDEKVVKRNKRKEDTELDKAKSAVSIANASVSNFNPNDVHGMTEDAMLEKYANLVF